MMPTALNKFRIQLRWKAFHNFSLVAHKWIFEVGAVHRGLMLESETCPHCYVIIMRGLAPKTLESRVLRPITAESFQMPQCRLNLFGVTGTATAGPRNAQKVIGFC